MSDKRNRPDSKNATDRWLTPPEIIEALGPFNLDPACEPVMPWRTAGIMVSNEARLRTDCCILEVDSPSYPPDDDERKQCGCDSCLHDLKLIPADVVANGLLIPWNPAVRVWLNCPWSDPLPWALKMARHGNGVWLSSGKSPETKWGQVILASCDAVLMPAGRPLFRYPDGSLSTGKWTPVIFAAWGETNVDQLRQLRDTLMPGVLMGRLA